MKKLNVDKHTGPLLVIAILAILVIFFGTILVRLAMEDFALFWRVMAYFSSLMAFFTFPWWAAYLWNRFVATKEDYYD